MVSAGEVQITGTMDSSNIERAQSRVSQGFNRIESQAASAGGSFQRLSGAAGAVGSKLATIGTAGVASMMGLASASPAVAENFAQIKARGIILSHTLGRALKPAFDAASSGFSDFVNFVQKNEGTIKDFTEGTVKDLKNTISGVQKVWSGFSNTTDKITKTISINTENDGKGEGDGGGLFDNNMTPAIMTAFLGRGKGLLTKGLIFTGLKGLQELGQEGEVSTSTTALGGAQLGGSIGARYGGIPGGVLGASAGGLIGASLQNIDEGNTNAGNFIPFFGLLKDYIDQEILKKETALYGDTV